ncbi:hypothetical protein [Carboxylicivirga sp. N1Y90]|uniref:hypothetical protein n=1 Tax=Carboxylicivirga fragile TaxID=3417571 RepID=UPI003D34ABDF|nr:hypothetical protein [Marinilabiliaceae bacterium N1Y90]
MESSHLTNVDILKEKVSFFGINTKMIECISFFDEDGLTKCYQEDSIKDLSIMFSNTELFAIVNMKGGRTVVVFPDEIIF